jgi:hypothetical protein
VRARGFPTHDDARIQPEASGGFRQGDRILVFL